MAKPILCTCKMCKNKIEKLKIRKELESFRLRGEKMNISVEEFIGIIFKKRIINEDFEYIDIYELVFLENRLKINNINIRITKNSIYEMIDKYGSIFKFDGTNIFLTAHSRIKYIENSNKFIDMLDSYFCAGIPKSIYNEIINLI